MTANMNPREDLETFRKTHHLYQTMIAGKTWVFYPGGVGSQTVVILSGAGAFGALGAEVMFPVIAELEQQFRVFSFGYPPDGATVREMVEGIHEVLEEQQVHQVAFLGHSLWHGRALLLESDHERDVTPQERANTQALFVDPSIHLFHHTGHLSFITHTKEFAEAVTRLLKAQQ